MFWDRESCKSWIEKGPRKRCADSHPANCVLWTRKIGTANQTAMVCRYSFLYVFSSVSAPRLRGVHLGSSLKRRMALMYWSVVSI